MGELLLRRYGTPSERTYEILDQCGTRTLGDCIRAKQAEFSMIWVFKDGHSILSSVDSLPENPLFLTIQYESPEGLKAVEHHGL